MLAVEQLIPIVRDLNNEIETEIDNISTIVNIVLETDGTGVTIHFGGLEMWTNQDEEINCANDLRRILLDRIDQEMIQIQGMFKVWSGVKR